VPVDPISELALEAWRLHRQAQAATPPVRVTPHSAPILYFGDLDAYRASSLRVITVGVNPSGEEYPAGAPWSRFPVAASAAAEDVVPLLPDYLRALNNYFQLRPYKRWFGSYEPALNGLDASYYAGAPATAIHTDVCTPVPTSPVWGGLERHEWRSLAPGGVALWHRLVEELEPHVILASVGARNFSRIALAPIAESEVIYTVEQARPLHIRATRVRAGAVESLLVTGGAATTPFQMINATQRHDVGAIARRLISV
jgi:hypothetical protein